MTEILYILWLSAGRLWGYFITASQEIAAYGRKEIRHIPVPRQRELESYNPDWLQFLEAKPRDQQNKRPACD